MHKKIVMWSPPAMCHTSLEASHPLDSRRHWTEMCKPSQFRVLAILVILYLFLVIKIMYGSLISSEAWKGSNMSLIYQIDLTEVQYSPKWYNKVPKLASKSKTCRHKASQSKVCFTHAAWQQAKNGLCVKFLTILLISVTKKVSCFWWWNVYAQIMHPNMVTFLLDDELM